MTVGLCQHSGRTSCLVLHWHPFLFSYFYLYSPWRSPLITDIPTSHGVSLDKACFQQHQSKSLHDQSTHVGAGPGPLKGHTWCVLPSRLGPHKYVLHSFLFVFYSDNKYIYICFLEYLWVCEELVHAHACGCCLILIMWWHLTFHLYHMVSISAPQFFLHNWRLGSDTGHQKKSIGTIFMSWALNLGGRMISEDILF